MIEMLNYYDILMMVLFMFKIIKKFIIMIYKQNQKNYYTINKTLLFCYVVIIILLFLSISS